MKRAGDDDMNNRRGMDGARTRPTSRRVVTSTMAGAVATAIFILGTVSVARATIETSAIVAQPVTVNGNMLFNFLHGSDNAVWMQEYTGSGWTSQQSMVLLIQGAPAAASWGANRVDVFVRDTNNVLQQAVWQGGSGFIGWFALGSGVAGDPVAVSTAFNRYDVLYKDVNGNISVSLWNGSQWSFPTIAAASVGVASRITVIGALGVGWAFWLGNNGGLYASSRESGTTTWTPPQEVSTGPFNNNPSAIAYGPAKTPEVFVRTAGGNLGWIELNGGTWTFATLGPPGTFQGSPAAVAWENTDMNIFFIGNDNSLWNEYYNGSWHGFSHINGNPVTGSPSVVNWGTANPPQNLQVYLRGTNGQLWNQWWDGQWHGYSSLGPNVFP
jgi:hypothetical protein